MKAKYPTKEEQDSFREQEAQQIIGLTPEEARESKWTIEETVRDGVPYKEDDGYPIPPHLVVETENGLISKVSSRKE